MTNKASIWCYISGVFSYIIGVVLCLSLLFAPIGIYGIIFGMRYFKFAKLTDGQLLSVKGMLKTGAIFVSILAFPIGLVSVIPYFTAGANNVKVSSSQENIQNENIQVESEPVKASVDAIYEVKEEQDSQFSAEDMEKLEKLARFKEQGLITEEEFADAKRKLQKKAD